MCEFEQNRSKNCQTNNQPIQLNPSQLQKQLEQTANKRIKPDKHQNTRNDCDKNDKMAEEPLTLSDYLNAISKTITEKKLIQKVLPTKFSREFFGSNVNEPLTAISTEDNETSLATIVQLNVYRLTDSRLGFYHTGLEFRNREYTYCFANGIIHHPPRKCKFAVLLGRVTLGPSLASYEQFWDIMRDMNENGGFGNEEYDVMNNSCNTFTAALSKRLGLDANYPPSILNQSRLGEFFAPLVESLGLTTSSSKGDPLDILEDEIANERKGSSDILSKHAIKAIETTASAPLENFKEIEVKDATRLNRKRSSSIVALEENKKPRPKTSPISRSLSSLTILGSNKSSKQEKEKSMSRARSASTVQLSEPKSGYHPSNCIQTIVALVSSWNITTSGFFRIPKYYRKNSRSNGGGSSNGNSTLESLSEMEEIDEYEPDKIKFHKI